MKRTSLHRLVVEAALALALAGAALTVIPADRADAGRFPYCHPNHYNDNPCVPQ